VYPANLIYEDRPQAVWWLKLVLGLVLAVTLIMGLVLLSFDKVAALVMLAITLFDTLLFYFILPRSYQIYADRLKIVLGKPWVVTIPFQDIRTVARASGSNAYGSTGIRFATSPRFVIEIARKGKLNVVISPSGGELFLEQFKRALKDYSSRD
jgi:hypothetical protein